jgi:phytoene dehydrogenase-like protein
MKTDVVIVGAGLAGLVCAQDLTRAGVDCCLIEASDGVGGRVRSDTLDGFILDRGFQILLSAYPQVQQRIDIEGLELGYFEPGAMVRANGRFHRVADPLRRPSQIAQTLTAPIGSLGEKARMARLVLDVRMSSVRSILRRPDGTTAERLAGAGLTDRSIDLFWGPLFAGIQLDPELEVSSRRFETILRMLAVGQTGLPRRGMGAIPAQIAATLPEYLLRLCAPVALVEQAGVVLDSGERIASRAVVVATDGPTAHHLLGKRVGDPGSRAAACCWFSAPEAPMPGPTLILDGESGGPALNMVVMSEVSPSYAPPGRSLVAAAVPGPRALEPGITSAVSEQLAQCFGSMTGDWELLRTDVIPHGQPAQLPALNPRKRVALGDGLFVCGDHRDTASLQGAMFSGERVAGAVLTHLHGQRSLRLSAA